MEDDGTGCRSPMGLSDLHMGTLGTVVLPRDKKKAAERYVLLRDCVRETFHSFLRNMNSGSLRFLENQFVRHRGAMNATEFLRIFSNVFPKPPLCEEFATVEEQKFIVQLAVVKLFEGMDVDGSGETTWMEFVEFVCAVAEELRLQALELSGNSFDFHPSALPVPYRPAVTKCHFDQVYYWPEHPSESVVIFEEGQPYFHLHRPGSMQRKRRVEGHNKELVAATFLPAPFEWVVTAGNDRTVCFWDPAFNLVKRWTVEVVVGAFCWCTGVNALYFADHFSERVRVWHLVDPMSVRASDKAFKPDRGDLELHSGHTKPVQAMVWLKELKTLATASLDATIQLFDLVQHKRTHTLAGHTKGLTCIVYCPKMQMLLSSGFDHFIIMWDPSAGTRSHTLSGHDCSIVAICAVPTTDFEFLSVDVDGVVKVWDVRRLICVQSLHATDVRAEMAGEQEPLAPRAICPLGRDRVVVSGRRVVVFDRRCSDPFITGDYPLHAVSFNQRKLEILTPMRNDVYVWCAVLGKLLTIHNNVTEGNVTAVKIGLGERRIFVGSDTGEVNAINYDCGAPLKQFTRHGFEVTQIECMAGKLLTFSAAERAILIHDDKDSKKAITLKRIGLCQAGGIVQISHDGLNTIAAASEDGDIYWYNMEFAKLMGSSAACEVLHRQAVSCVRYLRDVPLIVSADAEGCLIFWSVPPLRNYQFFNKATLSLAPEGGEAASSEPCLPHAVGVTSLEVSWPREDFIFVGTERGTLACVYVGRILDGARQQLEEILRRKESGAAVEVISGKIFSSMPKPTNSREYVFPLPNRWLVSEAHRGSIEDIALCQHNPTVILTLGVDICVRMWQADTGEALGTLEQGAPHGVSFDRRTLWRFPIDGHEQLRADAEALRQAAAAPKQSQAAAAGAFLREAAAGAAAEQPSRPSKETSQPAMVRRLSKVSLSAAQVAQQDRLVTPKGLSSTGFARSAPSLHTMMGWQASPQRGSTASTIVKLATKQGMPTVNTFGADGVVPTREWLVGSAPVSPAGACLPRLQSGLRRQHLSDNKKVVEAALRLSSALGGVQSGLDR